MSTASDTTPTRDRAETALTLADSPARQEALRLRAAIDAHKDAIAELELLLESRREELSDFEATLEMRLWREHDLLERAAAVVRHLSGWAEILQHEPRRTVKRRGRRHDARRSREAEERPPAPEPATEPSPPPPTDERLKAAYRALARRFHPDLAGDEAERVKLGALMARINALYKDGNLERLLTLAREPETPEAGGTEALDRLREREAWLRSVVQNMREEQVAIDASDTCALWRRHAQAGAGLFDELKHELLARLERLERDVLIAMRELEVEVERYNRQRAVKALSRTARAAKTEVQLFDPQAHHRLVRLSLEALAARRASAQAKVEADLLEAQTESRPAVLRLILFAYVTELSPLPLKGLESFADLELRFDSLTAADPEPLPLARALIEGDRWVSYGVRQATERVAKSGLRLLQGTTREALPIALGRLRVRRELKRVLAVLGEHRTCNACGTTGFTMPVFSTRGLDSLRANLCQACGHALERYWMPRGKDVQAVLNPAYLDLELVSEWTLHLHRATVATQLLPVEVESRTVKALKDRLFTDLFERYALGLKKGQVSLWQGKAAVPDRTPLASLTRRDFTVRLDREAKLTAAEAVELLKHRVRNRFKQTSS